MPQPADCQRRALIDRAALLLAHARALSGETVAVAAVSPGVDTHWLAWSRAQWQRRTKAGSGNQSRHDEIRSAGG